MYKTKYKSGDYLDYAVEYFRQNVKTFFFMTLVFHVPVTFIMFFLLDLGNIQNLLQELIYSENETMAFIRIMLIYLGILLYSFYNMTLTHTISLGTMKHTYENVINGTELRAGEALKHGFKRFLWYVLYLLLLSTIGSVIYYVFYIIIILNLFASAKNILWLSIVFTCLVSVAGVCAVIYFLLRFYFVPHAISIERLDCFKAASLSWRLTKKRVRRIILPIFFGLLFTYCLPLVVRSLTNFVSFNDPLTNRILFALVMAISCVLYPIQHIHTTQLYIYLKSENGILEFTDKLNDLIKDESDKITFGKKSEVAR